MPESDPKNGTGTGKNGCDPSVQKDLLHGKTSLEDAGDKQTLFEEYKVFVDTTEKAMTRRQVANSFFLTANSILLTAAGVMAKQAFDNNLAVIVVVPIAAVGILLCVNWCWLIRNYRQLNAAKFEVIHCLERHLPAALFEAEWTVLGRGKDAKKYMPISKIEERVAVAFTILYVAAIVVSIVALRLSGSQPGVLIYRHLFPCVIR